MVVVQVHVLVLEPIQPVNHVRAAGVDVCLRGLVFDGVVYVFLLLQELGEERLRFAQGPSDFEIDPGELLIWFETVAVEVLVFAVVSGEAYPVSMVYAIFVENYTVIGGIREQLVQVSELR